MTPEQIAQLQAENERLKAQARQARQSENAAFLDGLFQKGKLAPIARQQAESLLNYASDYDHGETLDFSEGDSLTQQVKDFLEAQPAVVSFGEFATAERAGVSKPHNVQYAENTDPAKISLDQKIRRYMEEHNTDYTRAFLAITQGGN